MANLKRPQPTVYVPKRLSKYTVTNIVVRNGMAKNSAVTNNLFEKLVFKRKQGKFIHAEGIYNGSTHFVVMEKIEPKPKRQIRFITK